MIIYIDSASFSNATSVYLDELLTIIAPDGYYSDGSYYRQQISGNLIDLLPCVGIDTVSITNVGATTATFNGNLINNGGDVNAIRGFVYGITTNPTTANSVITDTVRGQGVYSLNVTGLTSGVTYYVRAYATVFGETLYGDQLSFTYDDTCLGYTISSNNPLSSATVNFIECNGDAGSLSVGFGTGFDSLPFCAKDGQYTVVGDGTVSYTGNCTHTYLLSSPGKSSRTLACAETTYPLTVYSYTFPIVDGTILYTNNTGGVLSTPVTGGNLWHQSFIDTLTFQIGNDGVVSNASLCV